MKRWLRAERLFPPPSARKASTSITAKMSCWQTNRSALRRLSSCCSKIQKSACVSKVPPPPLQPGTTGPLLEKDSATYSRESPETKCQRRYPKRFPLSVEVIPNGHICTRRTRATQPGDEGSDACCVLLAQCVLCRLLCETRRLDSGLASHSSRQDYRHLRLHCAAWQR